MEIIIKAYKDPATGLDWDEQTPVIISELESRLKEFPDGEIEYKISETNHGEAADFPTITLTLLSLAGTAFFAIPAAHKKIRESIEEWGLIRNKLEHLINWLSREEPVSYPSEILFLDSLAHLENERDVNELIFLNANEIPVKQYFGFTDEKAYLFTFSEGNKIIQIAINSNREILWKNTIST